MFFNSFDFAIFLPVVFVLYWFVLNRSLKAQNLFIVAASYLFYAWWDWRFLFLIALTTLCSWISGLLIQEYRGRGSAPKLISAANIVLNLSILCVFKYYDFFVTSFADLFLDGRTDGLLLNVILPVGISFYTFQALGYSIDVYRGKVEPTRDIISFFAFVSFFPQLVAGPIERASNLLPQFQHRRVFDYAKSMDGLRQILWGLFKKMVVADNCAVYVDQMFSTYQDQSGSTLLLAAVLFAFQIYGDFSGYSDIAIGTSKLFGIQLMRNFNVPYLSRDTSELWRRWHISLTTWLRDYVFIPLGGSRCSKPKVIRNTFVVFLVCGLWHGADWNCVAWGAYSALLLSVLILMGKGGRYKNGVVAQNRSLPTLKELLLMLKTFLLFVAGLIIFRSETIADVLPYFRRVLSLSLLERPVLMERYFILPLLLSILVLIVVEWADRKDELGLSMTKVHSGCARFAICLVLAVAIAVLNPGTGNQFFYFQF